MSTGVVAVFVIGLIMLVTFALLLMLAVHNAAHPGQTETPKYRMMKDLHREPPTWKEPGEE